MKLPRPILDEFRRNKIKLTNGYFGETEHFHIRILERAFNERFMHDGERSWKVQFAYKPTFDRWANSTNFETTIDYSPEKNRRYMNGTRRKQYSVPKLDKELEWCLRCAESGIFNFNTYFPVIKTPHFIY